MDHLSEPLREPAILDDDGHVLVTRRAFEIITALAAFGFGVLVVIGALEHNRGWGDRGPEPGYFPFWIGLLVSAGAIGVFIQLLTKPNDDDVFLTRGQFRRLAAFTLPMIGFVLLSIYLGVYVATMAYLLFVMIAQGGYRVIAALAVSVGTAATFFTLFEIWLRVPLLKGPLEALAGIH